MRMGARPDVKAWAKISRRLGAQQCLTGARSAVAARTPAAQRRGGRKGALEFLSTWRLMARGRIRVGKGELFAFQIVEMLIGAIGFDEGVRA
jgi:hypothetical protein